jgi:hypothetical protein
MTNFKAKRSASVQAILDDQNKDTELPVSSAERPEATPASVPAIVSATALPAATSSNDSIGDYLKAEGVIPSFGEEFNFEAQKGFYRWRDGTPLTAEATSAIYLALTSMTYAGVIMFAGPGERPVLHLELVGGGNPIPSPEQYGGTEDDRKCEWPTGMSGKPENPWRRRSLLPCVRQSDGTAVTFVSQNWTSEAAVRALLGHQTYTLDLLNPGSWPLITFGTRQGKNQNGQLVPKCRITPCGRLPRAEAEARLAASVPHESGDPADGIPF